MIENKNRKKDAVVTIVVTCVMKQASH